MEPTSNKEMPTVLLKLNGELFGISSHYVKEMVAVPDVAAIPNVAHYFRGIINLRGKVMPLIDMRLMMGIQSSSEETNELLKLINAREQDHVNWMNELEASVREAREFKLATDPHACAFGKWFDHYDTTNLILKSVLAKFPKPHEEIHSTAIKVRRIIESGGQIETALNLITNIRETTMKKMIGLFHEFRDSVLNTVHEIAVILVNGESHVAIAVDTIESVEILSDDTASYIPGLIDSSRLHMIESIGKRKRDDSMIMNLDPRSIFSESYDAGIHSPETVLV